MNITVDITGRTPLVLHNIRLSDPLDPFTRAIAELNAKGTQKTEADHAEVGRLEWEGSLYPDPENRGRLVLPAWNVVACIRDGAKGIKKGVKVTQAVLPTELACEVANGSGKVAMKDENTWRASARNSGMNRGIVIRTRPRFRDWSLTFEGWLAEDELSFRDFEISVERAGRLIGIGDAKKLGYGRFEARIAKS